MRNPSTEDKNTMKTTTAGKLENKWTGSAKGTGYDSFKKAWLGGTYKDTQEFALSFDVFENLCRVDHQRIMAGLDILSPEGLRLDGRRPHELRKIVCRMGVFKQADGSAYIEMGNTKALATVYGPHEVTNKSKILHDRVLLNCQFSMATFSTGERKKRPKGDRRSTETSMLIRRTFEAAILTQLYPRSQIDIYVQILQADGSNQSACINAATLALIDAGIPMKDYVSACTVSFINDKPLMDINYLEESFGGPQLSLAVLPKSGKIVMFQMDSRLHVDNLEKVLDLAKKGCSDIHILLRQTVHDYSQECVASFTSN